VLPRLDYIEAGSTGTLVHGASARSGAWLNRCRGIEGDDPGRAGTLHRQGDIDATAAGEGRARMLGSSIAVEISYLQRGIAS